MSALDTCAVVLHHVGSGDRPCGEPASSSCLGCGAPRCAAHADLGAYRLDFDEDQIPIQLWCACAYPGPGSDTVRA